MDAGLRAPRVLGARHGGPGPTLIVVGGIHGNEPAGVRAAQRLVEELRGVPLRGSFHAFAGNLRALAEGRRYLGRDLNRLWTPLAMARARTEDDPEARELLELAAELDAAVAAARGPVYLLDLHTTSAAGVPFGFASRAPEALRFGAALRVPLIVGLETRIEGVLSGHAAALGAAPIAVEGGQHDSPEAQANLDAALLLAVAAAGLADLPGADQAAAHLAHAVGDVPLLIEVTARHAVAPGDGFRMEPGFANIAPVRAGTLLARDRGGEIRAPSDGLVLLPLYQAQGEDGFFFGRELAGS
jgi:predicted deacylase